MSKLSLSQRDQRRIDDLVNSFEKQDAIPLFLKQLKAALADSKKLAEHTHSIRSRVKNPDHLRDKLARKLRQSKEKKEKFPITKKNLLTKINDLAGLRILHLYTRQIVNIDKILKEIFDEQRYKLVEGPFARTWDDESRGFFKECDIETQDSPSLYTSVHYVVESGARAKVTCEIQVRTLMEEVWGEVDHAINYPHRTGNLACAEQLKVLARVTSSATRLVDSIFRCNENSGKNLANSKKQKQKNCS